MQNAVGEETDEGVPRPSTSHTMLLPGVRTWSMAPVALQDAVLPPAGWSSAYRSRWRILRPEASSLSAWGQLELVDIGSVLL